MPGTAKGLQGAVFKSDIKTPKKYGSSSPNCYQYRHERQAKYRHGT
jgi:hypothetical protein